MLAARFRAFILRLTARKLSRDALRKGSELIGSNSGSRQNKLLRKRDVVELGSLIVAMRKQFDADLIERYLASSTTLRVKLATASLPLVANYCRNQAPILLVCDANFPRLKAFAVGEQMRSEECVSQLLFLDECYNPSRAKMAQIAQAAYCTKSDGLEKIVEVIEKMAFDHQSNLTQDQAKSLIDSEKRLRLDCPIYSTLSNRELEVLTMIAEGNSVFECAEKLGLAPSTVDNHKSRLMKKLGIHKMTGLVRIAIRHGLIEP